MIPYPLALLILFAISLIGIAGFIYSVRFISKLIVRATLIIALASLIYAALMLYAILVEPNTISITHTHIDLPGLEEEITIAFLSDTHLGAGSGEVLDAAVAAANAEKPDYVLLGGDYIDSGASDISGLSFLGDLSAGKGIYAVMGNHDYDSYGSGCPDAADNLTGRRVRERLESMGIIVLENEAVELSRDVVLVGLGDLWACRTDYQTAETESEGYASRVLLTHNQDAVPKGGLKDWVLTLTGHTHCGQVQLPFIGSVPKNLFGFSGEYDKGPYRLDEDSHIYTACGVGGFPFRLLAPPEVSIIHLS